MTEIVWSKLRSYASASWFKRHVTEPLVIVSGKNHEPTAVLIPYETYLKWKDTMHRMSIED